jgi:peptidoglycan/LPS O-acetylase OafA/YrhL
MEDLEGLRGVSALWVMIFHAVQYSTGIDMQGSALMPLFFLLSGFSLTIGYIDKLGDSRGSIEMISALPLSDTDVEGPILGDEYLSRPLAKPTSNQSPTLTYYVNRLVRTLPVNTLCFLSALPMFLAGYGAFPQTANGFFWGSIIQNLIPVVNWTFYIVGAPVNGPMWTISTLMFFWLVFPALLARFRQKTDEELLSSIAIQFWIQLLLIIVLFPLILVLGFGGMNAFFWPTTVPYFRLPVFLMGINAGILCRRHRKSPSMPWRHDSCNCHLLPLPQGTETKTQHYFIDRSASQAIVMLSIAVVFTVGSATVTDFMSSYWLQGLLVYSQLDLIVCLYRSDGLSLCSRLLRSDTMQFLGKISMSLYLVHWPIIFDICWIKHGSVVEWPSTECLGQAASPTTVECANAIKDFVAARTLPLWGIPLVILLSLLAATALHFGFDVPIQKTFKLRC